MPLAPFVAQTSAVALASLAVRLLLLFGVAVACRRRSAFIVAGAAFVASLVVAALFVPFAGAALAVVARERWRAAFALALAAAAMGAMTLGLAWLSRPSRSASPSLSLSPSLPATTVSAGPSLSGDVARWRARRNLFRARWTAVAWAKEEAADPGAGFIELARLDHDIGEDWKARRAIDKVITRSTSPSARAEAERLGASLPP